MLWVKLTRIEGVFINNNFTQQFWQFFCKTIFVRLLLVQPSMYYYLYKKLKSQSLNRHIWYIKCRLMFQLQPFIFLRNYTNTAKMVTSCKRRFCMVLIAQDNARARIQQQQKYSLVLRISMYSAYVIVSPPRLLHACNVFVRVLDKCKIHENMYFYVVHMIVQKKEDE